MPALAQSIQLLGVFLQDSWNVTPRLTLNIGVRCDYESPRIDRFNQLTNFDYASASPLSAPGLAPRSRRPHFRQRRRDPPRTRCQSRSQQLRAPLRPAYRLTPKTVIRTGGGIFYWPYRRPRRRRWSLRHVRFSCLHHPIVTSLDGINPIVKWTDPYPTGFNRPTGSSSPPALAPSSARASDSMTEATSRPTAPNGTSPSSASCAATSSSRPVTPAAAASEVPRKPPVQSALDGNPSQ